MQNHPEVRLQDQYHKRFWDFKIGPKFSETLVFRGTILYPLEMMRYSYL